MGSINHTKVTGAPADATALVDGPAWDAAHTFSLSASDVGIVGSAGNSSLPLVSQGAGAPPAFATIGLSAVSGLGTGVATALGNAANATGGVDTVNGTATLLNKTIDTSSPNTIKVSGVDISTAWTTYTPSVTAGAGTPTTVSVTGRYKQIGKTIIMQASVTVTSVGTAASNMQVTVPVTASTAANYVGCAFESGVTGKSGAAVIQSAFPTKAFTTDATGATWWANGKVVDMTISYEIP